MRSLKYSGLFLNLKSVHTELLKIAPVRVCFSPGFLPGAEFPGEHVCADFQLLQRKLEPRKTRLTSLLWILFGAGFPEEYVFRG
jgi:hypothetical protein